TQSKAYKDILTQLKDPTVVLTDAERARLEILKGIQAQNLEDTIYQTNRAYKDGIADVRKAEQALADLEATQAAYTLVTKDQLEAIKRRDELSKTKNRTDAETLELSKLNIALMATEFQRQTELLSLGDRIGEQKEKANALNGATAESVRAVAAAVEAETLSISQYALTSPDFYSAVMAQVDAIKEEKQAIEARNKAIKLAGEAFKEYGDASQETLERLINLNSANKDSAYSAELVRLATEKLNEILAEKAKLAETEAEKEKARAEIIANTTKAISDAEKVSIALGDAYDLTSSKAGIFTSAIETLIESGLEPSDDRIQTLIASLQELGTTTEEATEALGNSAVEAFKKSAQSRADAYKEIDSYRQSDYSKEMQAIREKAEAFLKAGVEEVDVAKWQSEQWDRIHKAQADKAEEEAKRARDAWVDASFGMLSSITSIWGSINQVQENQNQSELQRIKEQN
ncbi:MAG TPA: hypothetical protein PK712_08730, partial [Rectinema sp.]|nr:hypothetical protein [Rectinema sp.]